jgi:hypothetical protein
MVVLTAVPTAGEKAGRKADQKAALMADYSASSLVAWTAAKWADVKVA